MTDLFDVQLTDHARMAFSTLGAEDRRIVDSWLAHLQNWKHDEFIRSHSRLLNAEEQSYIFETSNFDLLIAFRFVGDNITVYSIFRRDVLRKFQKTAEAIAS